MISSSLRFVDDEGMIYIPVIKTKHTPMEKLNSFALISSRFNTKSFFHHSSKIKIMKEKKAELEKKAKEQREKEELEKKKLKEGTADWATPKKGQNKEAQQETAATASLKKKISKRKKIDTRLRVTRFGGKVLIRRTEEKKKE